MPIQQIVGGTVTKTSRSGTSRVAWIEHDNPDPPPDKLTITMQCSVEDYQDFRAALTGGLLVDVDYDDAGNTPTVVALRRP